MDICVEYIIAICIICVCIYIRVYVHYAYMLFELNDLSPYVGPIRSDQSIFVSIASYRDRKCSMTVRSILKNATYPNLVFLGICQQNDHDLDDECISENQATNNIRIVKLDYTKAKGPCYARYLCSCMYRGETYYVQIDSHTVFTPGWDTALTQMMERLPHHSVISHYPQPINIETFETEQAREHSIPVICGVNYENDTITFKGLEVNKDALQSTVPNINIGASGGFLCMPGEAVQLVPFDPNLDMLFQGEEILYSARLFTNGFDFYPPSKNLVYHYYDRKEEPKFWNDIKKKPEHDPKKIVMSLLKYETTYPDNYGLGNVRSVYEYWELLGYDFENNEIYKNTCNTI